MYSIYANIIKEDIIFLMFVYQSETWVFFFNYVYLMYVLRFTHVNHIKIVP